MTSKMYEMLPVKERTKKRLRKIKEDIGDPNWDVMVCDFVDILEEGDVSNRGDLVRLKQDIVRWLNEKEK